MKSICLMFIVYLPIIIYSQQDSLMKALDIDGFEIYKTDSMHGKLVYGHYIKYSFTTAEGENPTHLFDTLKIIPFNKMLKIAHVQKHFRKEIDNWPYLSFGNNGQVDWLFSAEESYIIFGRMRIRDYSIVLDAKTGKVLDRWTHRYWHKSPPLIRRIKFK